MCKITRQSGYAGSCGVWRGDPVYTHFSLGSGDTDLELVWALFVCTSFITGIGISLKQEAEDRQGRTWPDMAFCAGTGTGTLLLQQTHSVRLLPFREWLALPAHRRRQLP
jgi:hypothetical protein